VKAARLHTLNRYIRMCQSSLNITLWSSSSPDLNPVDYSLLRRTGFRLSCLQKIQGLFQEAWEP